MPLADASHADESTRFIPGPRRAQSRCSRRGASRAAGEEYPGQVPTKFFEKVTEHIWEIKTHRGKEQFRVLGFPDGDTIVVAVVGEAKKTRKLDQGLVEIAEDRYDEYMARKKRERP